MPEITKAVVPVGGLGTRMLPASKATAKEMLCVVDKPVIHYIAHEAAAAGITQLILVTRDGKSALEDYFDINYELESMLGKKGKSANAQLDAIRDCLPTGLSISSVRQGEPLGLGHAVSCAKPVVGDEAFAVMLPDVLIRQSQQSSLSDMAKMCDRYRETARPILMAEEVPDELVSRYGIIDSDGASVAAGEFFKMTSVVEKPKPDEAPSNQAIVGRYILPPEIFEILSNQPPGAGNEIQLTDAILSLMANTTAEGYSMEGESFDCGNKMGLMKANTQFALDSPELGAEFRSYLQQLVNR